MPDRAERAVLIMNPMAGGGELARVIADLVHERPWLDVIETSENRSALELAKQAALDGYGTVISGGGDGTLHHVVNGLWASETHARLGILPLGTANDFARSLDLPTTLAEALDTAHAGLPRPMDLVLAQDQKQRFVLINAATAGFSLLLDEVLDKDTKGAWGAMAYFRAAIDALPELEMSSLRVTADDELITARSGAMVVANGRYAGGVEIAPAGSPGDHLLDLVVVTAETVMERTALAGAYAMGQQLESEHIIHRQVRRVRIESTPELPLHCDGEKVGHTPIDLEVLPGAIDVMCPANVLEDD